MYVYYCRTYEKAVSGGGEREKGGHVLKDTTTVGNREMGTGISEASKRVPIFPFDAQGGKQVSSHFRQRNWVQAREAQIQFPTGFSRRTARRAPTATDSYK